MNVSPNSLAEGTSGTILKMDQFFFLPPGEKEQTEKSGNI